MDADGYFSPRLAERLRSDGFPPEFVNRLSGADFSSGRSVRSDAWARHNERIHVATVILASQGDFDAALDLAVLDWRDLLVSAGLADASRPHPKKLLTRAGALVNVILPGVEDGT